MYPRKPKAGDPIKESYLRWLESQDRAGVAMGSATYQSGGQQAIVPNQFETKHVCAYENFTRYITEDGIVTYRGRVFPVMTHETDDELKPSFVVQTDGFMASTLFYAYTTVSDWSKSKIVEGDVFYVTLFATNSRWCVTTRMQERWEFMNRSAGDIPAFGIVAIGGVDTDELDPVLKGVKQTSPLLPYVINGPRIVPRCCLGYGRDIFAPQWVRYNPTGPTPLFNEEWGPKPGSYFIEPDGKGLRILAVKPESHLAFVQWERHFSDYWDTTDTTGTTSTQLTGPNSNFCPKSRPVMTWTGAEDGWQLDGPDPCADGDGETSDTTETTDTTDSTGTTTTGANCCDGPDPNETTTSDTTDTTDTTGTTSTRRRCEALIPDYCGIEIGDCVKTYCIRDRSNNQPTGCEDPETTDTTDTSDTSSSSSSSSTTEDSSSTTTSNITDACDCSETEHGPDEGPPQNVPGCSGCVWSKDGAGNVGTYNDCDPLQGCVCPQVNVDLDACKTAFYDCLQVPYEPIPAAPCTGKAKLACIPNGWLSIVSSCFGFCECGFCTPAWPPAIDCDPCLDVGLFEVPCRCGICEEDDEDTSSSTTTCDPEDCDCRCEKAKEPTTDTTDTSSSTTTEPNCTSYCYWEAANDGTVEDPLLRWVHTSGSCGPDCECAEPPVSELDPDLLDCQSIRTSCVPKETTNTTDTSNTTDTTPTSTSSSTSDTSSSTSSSSDTTATTTTNTCDSCKTAGNMKAISSLHGDSDTVGPTFPVGGMVRYVFTWTVEGTNMVLTVDCTIATGAREYALFVGPGICGGTHFETLTDLDECTGSPGTYNYSTTWTWACGGSIAIVVQEV